MRPITHGRAPAPTDVFPLSTCPAQPGSDSCLLCDPNTTTCPYTAGPVPARTLEAPTDTAILEAFAPENVVIVLD